jgi:C1A family cysteine protease
MFLYYLSRTNKSLDIGSSIPTALNIAKTYGICEERYHKYSYSFRRKPSICAYENAYENRILAYFKINVSVKDFKSVLALGHPIIFGMNCKSSFEKCTGELNLIKEEEFIGNHSVICCGYDDTTKRIKIQNSWGIKWGDKGYCYMSYEYLESGLCSEAYILVDGINIKVVDNCSIQHNNLELKLRKLWDHSSSCIFQLFDSCKPSQANKEY